jgi:hypothetical protein
VTCDSPLLNSLIYFNDTHSGLWIAKLVEPEFEGSTGSPAVARANGRCMSRGQLLGGANRDNRDRSDQL